MLNFKQVLLQDNADIPKTRVEEMRFLKAEIVNAVEARDEYIEKADLDREFCHPAGNWDSAASNDFFEINRVSVRFPSGAKVTWWKSCAEPVSPSGVCVFS